MDTKSLLAEMKARFAHNSAKHYLKEKQSSKLLVADQGGLWKADIKTISFLYNISGEVVLLDIYDTPIKVDGPKLFRKLDDTYNKVMEEWYNEYKELENKR